MDTRDWQPIESGERQTSREVLAIKRRTRHDFYRQSASVQNVDRWAMGGSAKRQTVYAGKTIRGRDGRRISGGRCGGYGCGGRGRAAGPCPKGVGRKGGGGPGRGGRAGWPRASGRR